MKERCRYCGKRRPEVRWLIASPKNRSGRQCFICERCVQVCAVLLVAKNAPADVVTQANSVKEYPNE